MKLTSSLTIRLTTLVRLATYYASSILSRATVSYQMLTTKSSDEADDKEKADQDAASDSDDNDMGMDDATESDRR